MSKKIKVQLIRSFYGFQDDQINTVRALGLRRMNQVREHDDNKVIRGMIFKVKHLVKVI
jgi:large subunit ribosomal protein L30